MAVSLDLNSITLVDCTLREGEQFLSADFTSDEKLALAGKLEAFGIRYLELTNPAAGQRARKDCETLTRAYPDLTFAAHIRCHPEDVRLAVESGVDALHMVLAISPVLREASHKKGIEELSRIAIQSAELARSLRPDIQLRYSNEDAFRCPADDLRAVYGTLARSGLFDRFGVADTTGVAFPDDVRQVVSMISRETGSNVEWHGHNDGGCAVANAITAAQSGASHINCSILGLGERNGIAALEGILASLYTHDPAGTGEKYQLKELGDISQFVADSAGVRIPFNHPLVGEAAFSHKAGIHLKAVLNNPTAYEAIAPEDFGRERMLNFSHRLTGWNALRVRADAMGLNLTQEQLKQATEKIKSLADQQATNLEDLDSILQAMADDAS